ncbi:caspase family protein [Amycolatopsis sp. 195334CR]|uniref:caspase family protein n=1 Tax=Amycolatopsis sp. 195334CR TaxID=2814588 RepID=UPI001A8C86CC|nr:caspase family protein [Amycolatopsis sp. 195334CR]MBN6035553.1 caspase family protein [Amycolatopsis sp. 195334CR]
MPAPFLPDPALSRAVLIGTSDFQHHDRLPNLPAVANNLTDLAAALTDSRTGILAQASCRTVHTPESQRSLIRRLRESASQAEDVLFVYYAGHGKRHPVRDTLYLTVWETDPEELDTTAVPFDVFREVIANSPARMKLLILDCCYSGIAVGTMSGSDVEAAEIAVSGTSVITSAPKNKKSLSPPGERNTAFTGELLKLLVDGPRLTGQPLDVNQAFRSVQAALARRSLPQPKMSAGDTSGGLVLRRTPAPEVPPPRAAAPTPPAPTPPAPAPPAPAPPAPAPPAVSQPASKPRAPKPTPVEPLPEPTAPVPAPAEREASASAGQVGYVVSSWLLWLGAGIGVSFGIGAVAGAIFGGDTPQQKNPDLSVGIVMLVVAVLCGYVLSRRVRRARAAAGRPMGLFEAFPEIARKTAGIRTGLLWFVFVVSTIMSIYGPLAPNSTGTSLGTITSAVVSLVLVAVASGYALFRRRR